MAKLKIRGLTKRFGDTIALHPSDLAIADGEFVVVVGPSGCGKSTLLRLLAGLEEPSDGRVLIGDVDVTARSPSERGIAMVFQSYALYPHLTVGENIGFPLRMAKQSRAEIGRRVAAVAELLELTDLLNRKPQALSGGQRQRVSIGRAIVRDPAVLLLDEPLSNLDAGLRVRLRSEFAHLHRRLGSTMIYVTHDEVEAMTLADRLVVMREGRIVQVGAPLEVYEQPDTLDVARAIGSPAINLVAVTVVGVEGGTAKVAIARTERTCRVAVRGLTAEAVGGAATLGVRPERLRPDADGPLRGRVDLVERLGSSSIVHVLAEGGGTLVAQLGSDVAVAVDELLALSVAPDAALLFGADGRAYART